MSKEPATAGLPLPIASSPTTSRCDTSSNSSRLKKSSPASLSQQTSIEVPQEQAINNEETVKRVSPDLLNIKDTDDITRYEVINVNSDSGAEPGSATNLTSSSVYVAMSSSPGPRSPYTEDELDEEEEDENLSLTSPGTPCSQCLREEQESTAHISGQRRFFNGDHFVDAEEQSSEECYSIESGSLCCHSSCCDERHLGTRKITTVDMARGKRISLSEEAAAKLGQAIDETSKEGGDSSSRQLITYVTPGMETVPLEMCQDIPDVLI